MARTTRGYDWRACAVTIVIGLIVAVAAALVVTRVSDSSLVLTAVFTLIGTGTSRWIYPRIARAGSRPIDDETCPL